MVPPGAIKEVKASGCTWRVARVGLMRFCELCPEVGAAVHAPPVVRHQIICYSCLRAKVPIRGRFLRPELVC